MNILRELPPVANPGEAVSVDLEIFGMDDDRLHRDTSGTFACASICMQRDPDTVYMVFDERKLFDLMQRLEGARVVMHNALFDLRQLRRWTPVPMFDVWDTMIVEKDLWGGYYDGFSLADLARRYMDIHMDKSVRAEFSTSVYMTEEQIEYAAYDAWVTLQVYEYQKALETGGRNLRCYHEIDRPSIWAFLDFQPVKVNVSAWETAIAQFAKDAEEAEKALGFNVYSTIQVKKAFLEREKKTLKSTGEEVLALLDSPLAKQVLECRSIRKNISTYGKSWLEKYVEEGDLVYANFHITQAATGRSACSSPGLQQIPARKYPVYRTFFVARYGEMTVADVQAQEPRLLAHISGDRHLKQIFTDGGDIHTEVAAHIFGPENAKAKRFVAKQINLGTSYGMSAKGLKDAVNKNLKPGDPPISEEDAEKFLSDYFKKFSGVHNYILQTRSMAERKGYVESVTGRRVWINPHSRGWQNECINAPIQSSAADASKKWLSTFWMKCKEKGVRFPVVLFVHDELVLDHTPEEGEMYRALLIEAFDEAMKSLVDDVPFGCSVEWGIDWSCKNH